MSHEQKRKTCSTFAEKATALASMMEDVPPILLLCDPSTGERETPDLCPLSGEAGRVAVLSMTFCNPLALHAASVIEGAMT